MATSRTTRRMAGLLPILLIRIRWTASTIMVLQLLGCSHYQCARALKPGGIGTNMPVVITVKRPTIHVISISGPLHCHKLGPGMIMENYFSID